MSDPQDVKQCFMTTPHCPQASSASREVAAAAAAPNVARLPACTHSSSIPFIPASVCRRIAEGPREKHSPRAFTSFKHLLTIVRCQSDRILETGEDSASTARAYCSLTVRGADWGAGAAVGAAVGAGVLLSVGVDAAPPAEAKAPLSERWRPWSSLSGPWLGEVNFACWRRPLLMMEMCLRDASDCCRRCHENPSRLHKGQVDTWVAG